MANRPTYHCPACGGQDFETFVSDPRDIGLEGPPAVLVYQCDACEWVGERSEVVTMSATPSGPYNDIRLAVEALGFTITRISNLYLSRAVDGGLSAEVEAVRTATGPTNRAVWHITWYPTGAGGWQVSFGSGDYTVERTDTP